MTYPQNPDAGLPPRSISNVPVPDPSELTTNQLREAIGNLKNLLETQINGTKKELIEFVQRYEVAHRDLYTAIDATTEHRKELSDAQLAVLKTQVDAQFAAIQTQFNTMNTELRDQASALDLRYQQRYEAQTAALDAAFKAQQEATASALAAAKEAVQVALANSEKAIGKAESVTEKLMPRSEAESKFADLQQQLERRFDDLASTIETTKDTSNVAINKANDAIEKRFITISESLKMISQLSDRVGKLDESIMGLDRVTDAKFVTFRTLIDSQADKVALALTAADKASAASLAALDKSNVAALAAAERAVTKAEIANEKRFEAVDEFRQLWGEQTKTFVSRNEFNSSMAVQTDRANQLSSQAGSSMSRSEVESRFTFVSKQVDDLRLFTAGLTGKSQGSSALWGYVLGAVGLVGGLLGIFFAIR